jgi:hypothetical protein
MRVSWRTSWVGENRLGSQGTQKKFPRKLGETGFAVSQLGQLRYGGKIFRLFAVNSHLHRVSGLLA